MHQRRLANSFSVFIGQRTMQQYFEHLPRTPHLDAQQLRMGCSLILTVSIVGFALVAAYSFLRRMVAWAGPRALFVNGCYEWMPGRGMLYVIYGSLWIAQLGGVLAIALASLRLLSQLDSSQQADWLAAGLSMALATALFFLARWLRRYFQTKFIIVKEVRLPEVQVKVRAITAMKDAGDTYSIGTERFPNQASAFFHLGVFTRQLIRLACVLCCLAQLWISIEVSPEADIESRYLRSIIQMGAELRAQYQSLVEQVRDWQIPQPLAIAATYFAFALLWMLLKNNHQYLMMRFPVSLVLTSFLCTAIWLGVASLGRIGEYDYGIVYGNTYLLLWLVISRMHADLRQVRSYRRRKQHLGPISDAISQAVRPFLESVQNDSACRLPELTIQAMSERITHGARNIEEGDLFVTRLFGRYMRIAKVATERCTTASLRFLTVNRFTERGACWPSYAAICDPQVPVWDEDLFPIHAPSGFVDQRDSLCLPSRWNPVVYCPPTEERAETYYDTESYSEWDSSRNSFVYRTRQVQKTRYITVTCSQCRGAGRLEYERYLVTTWTTTRPTVTHPPMQMTELVEKAEEAFYYQLPIVDQGKQLRTTSQTVDAAPSLVGRMEEAGRRLADLAPELSKKVIAYNGDAYVYRADFVVGGLHAMNIRFSFLRSRTGWFFGKRPEFHFPKLPIGWATVGTWLFLPPISVSVFLLSAGALIHLAVFLTGEPSNVHRSLFQWLK